MNSPRAALRVLTFGRYADENFGGLERYVFELARGLAGKVQYTNIVAARGGAPDLQIVGDTIYARPWASIGGTPVCVGMPWHALSRHRREPFDIVHLHFPADPMAHLSTVLLPRSVKRVITWHSDIVRQEHLLRLYRPFLGRLLRSADAIILPSPAHLPASEQLRPVADSARFFVVPFGFDLERFASRPALADELRTRYPGRLLIFALGRHVYYKGFEYLIYALRELPDAVVMLGGRGPLTESLMQLARKLGVERQIDFIGRIPERDLPGYYHACDVFCMPSIERSEAFGIVQIEAMASGKPVVCCELKNGVTWVNQNGVTGLVVPPADATALARALGDLIRQPELRAKLGQQGRVRAYSLFTLEAMLRKTLDVYRQVLD
jgi:glycosyltransferase involved in cell wall biosynthesis